MTTFRNYSRILAIDPGTTQSARAKDGNVRQAIIDRFGGKDKAIGRKAQPGPLYGFKADLWAALAIGLTVQDQGA